MNQILMTEVEKKSKKQKKQKKQRKQKEQRNSNTSASVEITKIVRFFAVFIIIFGLVLVGHSSYAIYRDTKATNTDNLATVTMTRINDTLHVDVQSVYNIETFRYSWTDSEERSIPENATSFQEEIILPSENSVLTIILEDETGRAVTYTKDIIVEGVDIVKPSITIEQQSTSIRLTAYDETEIDYIIYQIDDGEQIQVDRNNEGDTTIEYAITEEELGRGTHTITATAYDTSGNSATAESEVVISTERPEINNLYVDEDAGQLIIEVSDADGLQSIEVNLNGQVYQMDDLDRTEATFTLNLIEGTNTFSITVTNVNGLSTSGSLEFDYASE